MTAQEARLIQQLSEFIRDWRREDTAWKTGTDERLRAVEEYIAADSAVNEVVADVQSTHRINRGQVLTAAGIVGSIVLGILNHLQ